MQYKIIVGKNNELYYKVYKNNTVKRIGKSEFEKHFMKNNKNLPKKGGDRNSSNALKLSQYLDNATRYNNYNNTIRYLAIGINKDDDKKIVIGIEPTFSQAKERVEDWCLKLCKYQVFDKKQKKLGARLIKELDGVDTFIDSKVCHLYNNGMYGIPPDSRKGEVYEVYYDGDNKEYSKGSRIYTFPGDFSL